VAGLVSTVSTGVPLTLILYEATSSLDSENERRVWDAIKRLHGRLTILVITHRLTTVRRADSIRLLEARRLVESGDWHGLLNGSVGRFRAMCEAQGTTRLNPVVKSPRPPVAQFERSPAGGAGQGAGPPQT
jgi:ABC-type multidrug transport system ATPase subunit